MLKFIGLALTAVSAAATGYILYSVDEPVQRISENNGPAGIVIGKESEIVEVSFHTTISKDNEVYTNSEFEIVNQSTAENIGIVNQFLANFYSQKVTTDDVCNPDNFASGATQSKNELYSDCVSNHRKYLQSTAENIEIISYELPYGAFDDMMIATATVKTDSSTFQIGFLLNSNSKIAGFNIL